MLKLSSQWGGGPLNDHSLPTAGNHFTAECTREMWREVLCLKVYHATWFAQLYNHEVNTVNIE